MMLQSATPIASDVTVAPLFAESLKRLQNSEARIRAAFIALDGLRQGLGGLPRVLVDAYNQASATAAPVLERRLQEYARTGGDASARVPLPRIVDLAAGALAEPSTALQAVRAAAARSSDWIPAARLAVTVHAPAESGTQLADWASMVEQSRFAMTDARRADLGIPAIAIVAIVLGVALVAAIVADVIRDFHADTTKQAALDAEARGIEAQAVVIQARINAYQQTFTQCLGAGKTPASCADLAAAAALRVGETPTTPNRAGSGFQFSLTQKVGAAAVAACAAAAAIFGARRAWRRRAGVLR